MAKNTGGGTRIGAVRGRRCVVRLGGPQSPGIRCPVTEPFWCSRDIGHPGAHVNRAESGSGCIGWLNREASA